jgi:hypothetical protein
LTVSNSGNGLQLSWDHNATQRGRTALLYIKDGQQERRIELDSKQLNQGSVMYWPENSDVNFRLEVAVPSGTITESIRSLGVLIAAPEAPRAPESPVVAFDEPLTNGVEAPQPAGSSLQPPRQTRTVSKPIRRTLAASIAEPGAANLTPVPLPDAPAIEPMSVPPLDRDDELFKRIGPSHEDLGPHTGAGSVQVKVEPVPSSRLGQWARNIRSVGKHDRNLDYVPPTPAANQPIPDPPSGKGTRDLNVAVKVYVNSSGKVEYAEVASPVKPVDRDLAAWAVFAARRWEFVPAHTTAGPVPGQVILRYVLPSPDASRNGTR